MPLLSAKQAREKSQQVQKENEPDILRRCEELLTWIEVEIDRTIENGEFKCVVPVKTADAKYLGKYIRTHVISVLTNLGYDVDYIEDEEESIHAGYASPAIIIDFHDYENTKNTDKKEGEKQEKQVEKKRAKPEKKSDNEEEDSDNSDDSDEDEMSDDSNDSETSDKERRAALTKSNATDLHNRAIEKRLSLCRRLVAYLEKKAVDASHDGLLEAYGFIWSVVSPHIIKDCLKEHVIDVLTGKGYQATAHLDDYGIEGYDAPVVVLKF